MATASAQLLWINVWLAKVGFGPIAIDLQGLDGTLA